MIELFHVEHSEPPARFSPCRVFRYELWRRWSTGPILQVIGLNPSTADEHKLDPTLRRVLSFPRRWGYGAFCMTNLFSFKATDPREMMRSVGTAVDDENDRTLQDVARRSKAVLCAWGARGSYLQRDKRVMELLESEAAKLICLQRNADGSPKHPLYVAGDVEPQAYRWGEIIAK